MLPHHIRSKATTGLIVLFQIVHYSMHARKMPSTTMCRYKTPSQCRLLKRSIQISGDEAQGKELMMVL